MDVYENIERLRKAKGITKTRMAHSLGISLMGYVHLSKGHVRLDVDRMIAIGAILEVDPAIFLDNELTDSVIYQHGK